jgi:hypothetical protein
MMMKKTVFVGLYVFVSEFPNIFMPINLGLEVLIFILDIKLFPFNDILRYYNCLINLLNFFETSIYLFCYLAYLKSEEENNYDVAKTFAMISLIFLLVGCIIAFVIQFLLIPLFKVN